MRYGAQLTKEAMILLDASARLYESSMLPFFLVLVGVLVYVALSLAFTYASPTAHMHTLYHHLIDLVSIYMFLPNSG